MKEVLKNWQNALIFCNSKLAKWLLLPGYSTIMLFLCVFSKEVELDECTIRHENIHRLQYVDCFIVGLIIALLCYMLGISWYILLWLPLLMYYIMYCIEYCISFAYHICKGKTCKQACMYSAGAMEMEAKSNEHNADYLHQRPFLAFVDYYGSICQDK